MNTRWISSFFLPPLVVLSSILSLPDSIASTSGFPSESSRVIGGEATDPDQWPAIGFFLLQGEESVEERLFCGASLIRPNWALTAAHCFVTPDSRLLPIHDVTVVFDHNDVSVPNLTEIGLSRLFIMPSYNPLTLEHDIALVELSEPIDHIEPLQLTSRDINAIAGSPAIVVGWGATKSDVNQLPLDFPHSQQEVTVPIVSRSICNNAETYSGFIQPSHLCAGRIQGAVDACQGDSGSALLYLTDEVYKQAGIVSFGAGCAQPYKYGVYTNVYLFRNWIDSITNPFGTAQTADDTNLLFGSTSGSGLISQPFVFLIGFALLAKLGLRRWGMLMS